ncbi:MAG: restriction endonuclease subunit S [Bacteroidales bacterium]|nr:restriction endonuclease subunit S [Bacteroidales bacterium]
MGKIDELIQRYCPDGVEYVRFGDALSVNRGKRLTKMQLSDDGQYYVYHGSKDTPLGKYSQFNVKGNTTIVVNTGGIGGVKFCDDDFWCSDGSFWIGHSDLFNDKYVYYYLSPLEPYFASQKRVGGVPTIDRSVVENVEIPVPPLPVQEEIVRILDNFTNLAAELQAELQARQQQYQYYRDTLLSFAGRDDVEWKKLGEVGTEWYRGAGIKRDEVSDEGTPCIRYGEIHTTYNIWFDECVSHTDESMQPAKKYADHGDILFAITSEDIPFVGNSVAYLGKKRIMVGGDIVVMKHDQDAKYMSYVLSTSNAVMQKGKGKVKSKVVHTNVPSLQEIVVPIPSLDEQRIIADILDNFHTLTNDLSQGLPAEIEARQQQYEFYRNQLLTFKRKEA